MRKRLIVLILASLVVTSLYFLPATSQLGWAQTSLLVLVVGVTLGLVLDILVSGGERFQSLTKEAGGFWEAIAWAVVTGFCYLQEPLLILLPLNLAARAELPTIASSCSLAHSALIFNPWNLTVIALLGTFFPAKTLMVRMFGRRVEKVSLA